MVVVVIVVPLVLAALGASGLVVATPVTLTGAQPTVHSNLQCRAIGLGLVGVELVVMPVMPLTRVQTVIDRKAKRSLSDGEGLRSGGCICQGWDSPATVDRTVTTTGWTTPGSSAGS
ncbi:hypothetical protein B0H65DRAFT_453347 [Neurospora tetraspora]|uniref:Uncharacterized protein n=1 Tax=Neurospora tetraspora TaxID=94610 RepID=A0AAE0JR09_9PEZI|nr:hypothetical protein B0H65DRAFT_453347 [Neurospora tetraspora]